MILYIVLSLILTFITTAVILRFLIPFLKSKKMGQKILDIGPRWHKSKEGTPTMGGLSFLSTIPLISIIALLAASAKGVADRLPVMLLSLLFALLNGAIGMIDDRTKFSKGQNEGLLPWQKYLLQLTVCVLYLFGLSACHCLSTAVYIPFFGVTLELGIVFYPLAILLITGIVNSVNLTDGIDGLAAGETTIVAAFFIAAAVVLQDTSLSIVSASLLGGCLGFLVYNCYPARVFMGDTGSLFLGGLVVGLGFSLGNPLILLVVGFLYICESLSDIIQVAYFKLTHGKRFFKMAPIHHHFEKCGWSEVKIVTVFILLTYFTCLFAFVFDILPNRGCL